MKKWTNLFLLLVSVIGLGACGNDAEQGTESSTAVSSTNQMSVSTDAQQSEFQKETAKIVEESDGEVLGITVTGQEGFDSIKVKMRESVKNLNKEEQLSICQKYQPKIMAAYQKSYVKENSGEHKPITNYFSDGTPIAMTERQQEDPEKLVIVE